MRSVNTIEKVIAHAPVISQEMQAAARLWAAMYKEKAPWLGEQVKSLGLSATIAAELARLVMLEMRSEIRESAYLDAQYQKALCGLRPSMERALATGGMVLKPYAHRGDVLVDFVHTGDFLPLGFDMAGEMTDVVFIDRMAREGSLFTRLERHTLLPEGVKIINRAFRRSMPEWVDDRTLGEEISLSSITEWEALLPETVIEGAKALLIAHFKVPLANNIDTESPLGISVFARAAGLIEQADRQYSRLLWEFESGERALYVEETAFEKSPRGDLLIPDRRLYRSLNIDGGDAGLFEDYSPTLRNEALQSGLDTLLCRIEDVTGLARGTLSGAPEAGSFGARTATEIRIMRQRTYATVTDLQAALRKALTQLAHAMADIAGGCGLSHARADEISFSFDDSVAGDRQAEFQERVKLLEMGILTAEEMRAWYLKLPEGQKTTDGGIHNGK